MSSDEGSQSLSSQMPLYLWGGSKGYKKRFVANMHRITIEDHIQKWHTTYASAIPDDLHVRLAAPFSHNVPHVDPNDLDARIITFHLFYFSLGFTFLLSKFFKKNDISKKLDLELDMAKVLRALSSPTKFCEWHWLLSKYQTKPTERKESSTKFFEKRKDAHRSSKDEAATSRARDVSPLRKKLGPPSVVIKSSSKKVSSAEKTQVGAAPSSSTRVKHLVGMDSKKIGGLKNVWDILLKFPFNKLKTCNLPYKEVCSRTSSPAKKQRATYIPHRSSCARS
ncbi:hypothetical protein ACE6H2_023202 [Prunus campanulata]